MTKINFNLRNVIAAAICLVGLTASVSAWAQDVQWKKNFGGSDGNYYYSVTAVSDGIVAAGYYGSSSFGTGDWAGVAGKGSDDAILVKYNNDGNVVWKKNFGGSGDDYYFAVTAVSDGVVAAGFSYVLGDGDWAGFAGKGGNDAILVKYDNNGNVVWKKNFGGSSEDYYYSVTAVSDGVVAAGYSYGGSFGNGDWAGVAGKGYEDAIIVKYDNNGDVLWKKNFGGSADDVYYSVTAVSDGVVAAGFSTAFGDGDWAGVAGKGWDDAILVKYDNNGNVVWKKNFGGSDDDVYKSVTAVSDGVVAAGGSNPSSFGTGDWASVAGKGGAEDAILVKYDNNGDVLWKKNFGGSSIDSYYSVTAVSDGVVATGYSEQYSFRTGDWADVMGKGSTDATLVKYDNNGNVVWKKNFGGSGGDCYYSVTAVSDGVVATGNSDLFSFGNGDWAGVAGKCIMDAIIVKYSITTGIEQLNTDAGALKIYPNPVKDELTIESGELTIENVAITDLSGRIVVGAGLKPAPTKPALTTGGTIINVSALPSGVYFIKVGSKAGKFVKE
ncbi:MAG: T9SS type A sorting domain-containing protein [Paludibacter sp.]|nr:T9SS type A sorting domain-containing protein [Paludibacter sp.]